MRMQRLWLVFLSFVGVVAMGKSAWADETTIDPTTFDFGNRALGVSTPTSSFTITFNDSGPMNPSMSVTSITSTGAGCGDYALNPASGDASYNVIADGVAKTVTVTFTPTVIGARPCTFTINDTGDGNLDTYGVTGNGQAAVSSPSPGGTLTIGSGVKVGTSTNGTITLSNSGNVDLNVSAMAISGTNANQFSIVSPLGPFTVTPSTPQTLTIACTPTSSGTKNAQLDITSNTTGGDSTVLLSCTGTIPTLVLSPATTLVVGGAGGVPLGSSADGTVQVQNSGDATLGVTHMAITGTNAGMFTFRDHSCAGLTPDCATDYNVSGPGSSNVVIRCSPTGAADLKTATLTVTSDSSGTPDNQVTLECNATQPNIVLTPATTLSYTGGVHSGSSGNATVVVSNNGNSTLTVDSMAITGTDATRFAFTDHSCTGQSCDTDYTVLHTGGDTENVQISCTPGTGTRLLRTATLTFTSDSNGSADNAVDLSCQATLPNLTLTAVGGGALSDPLPCGTEPVNDVGATLTTCQFQINNPNPSNEILDYTVSSSNSTEFAVSSTSGTTAINGSTVITITFDPTSGGSRSSTISVGGDGSGNLSFTVTGTGTTPTIGTIVPAALTLNLADTDITSPATTSAPGTISFSNTGNAPLNITAVALTGGNAAQFTIATGNTAAHSVAAGGSDAYTVTCTPVAPFGAKTTTFRITADVGGTPGTQFNITVNCIGLQASVAVTGTLSQWPSSGSILEGTTGNDSVVLTNSGNRAISVNSLMSGLSVFVPSISGGLPALIAANGGTVTVNVAFTPINGATSNTNITVGFDSTAVSPASLSIPVTGDGIHEGFDISIAGEADPGTVNLGDVRVLTVATRNVTMQNSSDVPINLTAPSSNDAHCVIVRVNPANYPLNNLAPGGTATFNINVTPDAVGGDTCTISMGGSVPSTGATLNEMIVVNWNGVAPEVTLLAPGAGAPLDFAGVDVDSIPMQLPVQVQNSGDFLLTITSCSITGPQAARFTVPACNQTLTAGTDSIIMVTYDPTIEALDGATLSLVTDSFPTGLVQVQLQGVGVDQHIGLPALEYTFPDTFRNPDEPPTQMIVVEDPLDPTTNAAAPLTISMAVTDASVDDVFVITDEGPFTVQPGADIDIPIEFRPTAYSTFSGVVTIFNDTTGNPMAQVTVSGMGISRNVMVSPGDIDLGLTGVNIPIRLSDVQEGGIQITNIDPDDVAYRVRSLALVDAAGNVLDPTQTPFSLDAEADLELAADGTLSYDAEFSPTEEGEYEVTVAVYLDNDPEAHALVTLHGTAVEVEVRGGGCQTGGDPSTGGLVVVALGLLALPWRRRGLVAIALVLALAGLAAADPTRNVDLQTFSPAPATEVGGFAVETADVGVSGAWALDLMFSHATNLLMVTSPSAAAAGMDPDTPVSGRSSVQLGFAYAFLDRFEAGLRVPMFQQTGTDPQFSGLAPADGTALGDVAAHGKANLVSTDSLAFGASLDLTLPTATDGEFAGVDGPTAQLRALAGWRSHRFGVNVNAGFLGRKTGDLGNIEQGSAITFGGGAWFRALESMYVIGETFGSAGMGDGVKQAESVLGVRYEVARSVGISLGGGRGIVHGVGSPDVRGFLLIDVAPKAREAAPLVIIIPPPPRDTRDDDGDGVINADDGCPAEKEDADEFQDEDGCADLDNDDDGLDDTEDKCPLEAEDGDGFLDEDGCVDGDNDADGILDLDDKCPMEMEDKDGYLDNDGCDEPDNDADGIPDVIDQCALEQETINGNNDDDGCPDAGDSLVMVMPDRIEIFEPVTFTGTTSTLTKKSSNILGQVAATMRANRDFKRLRVTVHVHPRGNGDQELSDKRAKVVREWLVQWGIEPERVEARGLGSTRPLVPKGQKGAAALNDRVEFIILEKDAPATEGATK